MLLTLGGCGGRYCGGSEAVDVVEMVEMESRRVEEGAGRIFDRSSMLCLLSNALGEIDLRLNGTSITEGLPENTTDTILAVSSMLLLSFVGDGEISLLESYSKSEKSPAEDEASSSEERYSSCGIVCERAGESMEAVMTLRPTRLSRSRDALRALFAGNTGASAWDCGWLSLEAMTTWSSIP